LLHHKVQVLKISKKLKLINLKPSATGVFYF